jgi:hypothetical protein
VIQYFFDGSSIGLHPNNSSTIIHQLPAEQGWRMGVCWLMAWGATDEIVAASAAHRECRELLPFLGRA